MTTTKIEWTRSDDGSPGMTWNPTRGCSLVSAGCTNCYAMRQAHRFSGKGQAYDGLTRLTSNGPVWTGEVRLAEDKLEEPLHWKKARRIFVNSMSDLFHESLEFGHIFRIFAVMQRAPQHTFQILTKRAKRMNEFIRWMEVWGKATAMAMGMTEYYDWPYPNTWLGVSVEDQKIADERIPWLLKTPAAVRWVSYEPALGPVDFTAAQCGYDKGGYRKPLLTNQRFADWIVVGGESGPGARPFDIQWARDTIAQCKAAGVPVFVKQLGARPACLCNDQVRMNGPTLEALAFSKAARCFGCGFKTPLKDHKGGDINEWPEDLRVRQYPNGD